MIRYLLSLTLPLYVLDQLTKHWILRRFPEPTYVSGDHIEVVPGFFNLVRVHNQGMAFGIGNGTPYANPLFLLIATVAVTAIVWLWRKGSFPDRTGKVAASLLLCGIFGNVTDRLIHGYVVDFLDFNLGFMRWPSFNVADSCICIAAGLLFILSFRPHPSSNQSSSATGETSS